jgi:aminoglycoside 6-adenylyltransferase
MIGILHKKILSLVEWYVAIKHDFKVNTGSIGRYLKKYLSEEEYYMIKKTYSNSDKKETAEALMYSFEVVRYFGTFVALNLGFNFPQKHDEDMYEYCKNYLKEII